MATRIIKLGGRGKRARATSRAGAAALAGRVRPAVRALRAGKLVAFPTETVYGVGVVATDAAAVERLRELKARPAAAFSVHMGGRDEVWRYVKDVPIPARVLMGRAWPGPVTVLLPAGDRLADPSLKGRRLFKRICPAGVIGLRCPDDPVARAILSAAGDPVLATSANLAGGRSPRSARGVLAQLDGRIDLLVDAGPAKYGQDSTIVAFDGGGAWRVVRTGVFDARQIDRLTRLRVLFVCTGNTCRSPMAAGLGRRLLAEHLGCEEGRLKEFGCEFSSAGGLAASGSPASANAVLAAGRLGAVLEKHQSARLTTDLIQWADMVFCMTRRHVADVARLVPAAAGKTFLLDAGGDIPDPIGGSADVYVRLAERMVECLRNRWSENVL